MPVDGESVVVETTHEASPVAMEACSEEVQQRVEEAEDSNVKVPGKLLLALFISNQVRCIDVYDLTDKYTFIVIRPYCY